MVSLVSLQPPQAWTTHNLIIQDKNTGLVCIEKTNHLYDNFKQGPNFIELLKQIAIACLAKSASRAEECTYSERVSLSE